MKKFGFFTFVSGLMLSTSVHASSVYVRDISVQGLERVEPETVMSYIDITEDSEVSQEKLDIALKQLYATGLFTDVVFDNILSNASAVGLPGFIPGIDDPYFFKLSAISFGCIFGIIDA